MTGALIRYDAACKAIAACKSVDEAKSIRDHADAMRAYAKQAKNKTLEVDAAEIRIRAERRVGQLIVAQKETIGLSEGGRPGKTPARSAGVSKATLRENGIDYKLSARAQHMAAVPEKKFNSMIGDWRGRVTAETERVTTNLLREGRRELIRDARPATPPPPGLYRLIYADPPWPYEHVPVSESRAIENQYPTMTLDAICAYPVPAAPDAVLFLWSPSPKLAEALRVIAAWGFTYRTGAVWDKGRIGMGYYFRQQHEHLLVAVRGELPVPAPFGRPPSVLRVPRSRHSAKPVEMYGLLERMYPTFSERDRVELFSRAPRSGWTASTNEPAVAL